MPEITETKGFKWSGFISPAEEHVKNRNYHVIGWNTGNKFDGYHVWDIVKGKRVKCQLLNKNAKKCKNCNWYRE